jgi:itaconate CoA-transferase
VQNEREFAAFCEKVLQDPALARDRRFSTSPARQQNRDALHAEIEKVFRGLKTPELIDRLEAADIANARLNDMEQFWRHPQLAARGRWAKVGSPAGVIDALKPPLNIHGMEPRMDAIPSLGEHSGAILAELGYSEREIEALAASGAVLTLTRAD